MLSHCLYCKFRLLISCLTVCYRDYSPNPGLFPNRFRIIGSRKYHIAQTDTTQSPPTTIFSASFVVSCWSPFVSQELFPKSGNWPPLVSMCLSLGNQKSDDNLLECPKMTTFIYTLLYNTSVSFSVQVGRPTFGNAD